MKLTRLTAILLVLFSLVYTGIAQELRGLNYNPRLTRIQKAPNFKSTSASEKGIVPQADSTHIFFDDFSTYGNDIFPNSKNMWIDNNATITRTYADSSISIGVATLDCFDSRGRVYGPTRRVNASDTLTSVLIDSIEAETLYISFFIQGGGKADPPEIQDSIVLEFLHHKSDKWVYAWSSPGYTSHTFEQVILPINDTLFADSCFQFRFINYTSLSSDEVQGKEGALSNADYWHIDYVQIREVDNISKMQQLEDAMITTVQESMFKAYTLIPYDHLAYAASRTAEEATLELRTYYLSTNQDIDIGRTHVYVDITNNDTLEIVGRGDGIQLSYSPFQTSKETDPFIPNYKIRDDQEGEGIFSQASYLNVSNDPDQYRWNDTVRREDHFRDFYAYDDGTAEFGFGMAGADAFESRMASRFEIYQPRNTISDLTGVYLYFNIAADEYNANSEFEVAVWEVGSNGLPGAMLYRTGTDSILTPDTNKTFNNPSNSTDGFMKINFTEVVEVSNEFFIGIIQYTTDFINLGYDISYGKKSNSAFYSENQWSSLASVPGLPDGSLMIRPKFDNYNYTTVDEITQVADKLSIYPNPAQSTVNIALPDHNEPYSYHIYNILGKLVASNRLSGNSISIENLPEGIYILQLTNLNSKQLYTQKLFKSY